jgi:hypothetical protein
MRKIRRRGTASSENRKEKGHLTFSLKKGAMRLVF